MTLFERFSNSLWGLLFSELINIVSIVFHNFIEFIVLLYTFLVISFARYKEYIICLISFSKFSDVLPTFTCARAIGNLWSICFGVNILIWLRLETLRSETFATRAMRAKSKEGKRSETLATQAHMRQSLCCLLKSRIFWTILTILFGFSFSGIFFRLISYFNSINSSLVCFTI